MNQDLVIVVGAVEIVERCSRTQYVDKDPRLKLDIGSAFVSRADQPVESIQVDYPHFSLIYPQLLYLG